MQKLNGQFFQMPNMVFAHHLTPDQFTVYCYLVCRAGSKDKCWPSVKTIGGECGLSENTVRKAIKTLVERGFISKVATKRYGRNGRCYQGNNHYYIQEMPNLARSAPVTPL